MHNFEIVEFKFCIYFFSCLKREGVGKYKQRAVTLARYHKDFATVSSSIPRFEKRSRSADTFKIKKFFLLGHHQNGSSVKFAVQAKHAAAELFLYKWNSKPLINVHC